MIQVLSLALQHPHNEPLCGQDPFEMVAEVNAFPPRYCVCIVPKCGYAQANLRKKEAKKMKMYSLRLLRRMQAETTTRPRTGKGHGAEPRQKRGRVGEVENPGGGKCVMRQTGCENEQAEIKTTGSGGRNSSQAFTGG
jgi:hypothetical protein